MRPVYKKSEDVFSTFLQSLMGNAKGFIHGEVQFLTHLKKHFWKEQTFWSDGYFCCTIGNASQKVIRKYIENQD